jgi:hypothetical protein
MVDVAAKLGHHFLDLFLQTSQEIDPNFTTEDGNNIILNLLKGSFIIVIEKKEEFQSTIKKLVERFGFSVNSQNIFNGKFIFIIIIFSFISSLLFNFFYFIFIQTPTIIILKSGESCLMVCSKNESLFELMKYFLSREELDVTLCDSNKRTVFHHFCSHISNPSHLSILQSLCSHHSLKKRMKEGLKYHEILEEFRDEFGFTASHYLSVDLWESFKKISDNITIQFDKEKNKKGKEM